MRALSLALLLLAAFPLQAREDRGVDFPDTVAVDGESLVLNGVGTRTKFFFKVYHGALYLPTPARTAEAALAMPGPKRVVLHILREIDRDSLVDALKQGFADNQSPAQLAALQPRIERFAQQFRTVTKGERVVLDFTSAGTEVTVGEDRAEPIEGEDFQRALLEVWLGEEPADGDLKRGMLGG